MRPLTAVVSTLVVILAPTSASADSDGYFCMVPGLIAYELRFTAGPDGTPPQGHWLYVIRFDANGIHAPDSIELPQDQVHRIQCKPERIEISTWDGFLTVPLNDGDSLGPVGREERAAGWVRRLPNDDLNLGDYYRPRDFPDAEPGHVPLPASDAPGEYELRLTSTPHPTNRCRRFIETWIQRLAPDGTVRQRVPLIRAETFAECGADVLAGE